MSIISALVAKQPDIVLAEYTTYKGNFISASRLILQKIKQNTIGVIKSGIRKFYFVSAERVTYMCLVEDIPEETAFGFLHDLKSQVIESKYPQDSLARMNAYGLKNVESEISELIEYFNVHPVTTRSGQPIEEFRNLSNIISESLNKFLDKEITLIVQSNKDNEPLPYGKALNSIVSSLYNLN